MENEGMMICPNSGNCDGNCDPDWDPIRKEGPVIHKYPHKEHESCKYTCTGSIGPCQPVMGGQKKTPDH